MNREVNDLIRIRKLITNKRRPDWIEENRHYKINLNLFCPEHSEFKFIMFLRKQVTFPANFTIGLRMDTPNPLADSSIVLVRFQGPHGGQSGDRKTLHNDFHIHLYTEDDLLHKRKRASYKGPGCFNSFEEAVLEFLKFTNIADPSEIFNKEAAELKQLTLPID